jgi:branched-chain amino acid transport system substrate-binding protein
MKTLRNFAIVTLAATAAAWSAAAEPLKIGVVVPLSGPYADHGTQMLNGFNLYLKRNGNKVAGREVVLVVKDETGPAPDVVKRVVQELIVKDKVDVIAGFDFTPNALAIAPLVTQAKIPTVITNAATSGIPKRSPYLVRTSFVTGNVAAPVGAWAVKNGIKKAYMLVADFSPGHDAEQAFKGAFTAAGGAIIGEARVPLQNPEFAPFVQRVKDEKPDAVFLYSPAPGGVAFTKVYVEKQLAAAGIKLLSTGDLVEEDSLDALGNSADGIVTSHHYSSWHDSALNKQFVADYQKAFGAKKRPNFYAVGSYDGMHVIFETVKKLDGKITADAFINKVKGMSFESPRGPVKIDAESRDIVQNVYVRKTEKGTAGFQNMELAAYPGGAVQAAAK